MSEHLRTCWCDSATYEDDDGVLRCWDCAGMVAQEKSYGALARAEALIAGHPEFWTVTEWPIDEETDR